jgi:uncharacterized protein YaiL (DUF2058 family)
LLDSLLQEIFINHSQRFPFSKSKLVKASMKRLCSADRFSVVARSSLSQEEDLEDLNADFMVPSKVERKCSKQSI